MEKVYIVYTTPRIYFFTMIHEYYPLHLDNLEVYM